jgi:hypothetical protein
MIQQQGDREDRRGRIGDALARNVRGRPVHRFEHRREATIWIDVAARGQSDATRDCGGKISKDVAKEVVGHDDVETRRVGDEEDRCGINVQVIGSDSGVLGGHCVEDAVPQPAGINQHVVLVNQRDLVAAPGRALERVSDDAFRTVRGVDAHLSSDLLWSAGTHQATIAAVQALSSLPYDNEINVFAADNLLREWRRHAGIEPARPQVDVVVESEAQLQQESAFQQPAWHVRRARRGAHGAEQDHVGSAELGQHRVWEDLTGALPTAGSEVISGRGEDARARHGIEYLESLGDHLRANTIPADHSQVEGSAGLQTKIVTSFGTCVAHRRIVAAADGLQRRDLMQVAVA